MFQDFQNNQHGAARILVIAVIAFVLAFALIGTWYFFARKQDAVTQKIETAQKLNEVENLSVETEKENTPVYLPEYRGEGETLLTIDTPKQGYQKSLAGESVLIRWCPSSNLTGQFFLYWQFQDYTLPQKGESLGYTWITGDIAVVDIQSPITGKIDCNNQSGYFWEIPRDIKPGYYRIFISNYPFATSMPINPASVPNEIVSAESGIFEIVPLEFLYPGFFLNEPPTVFYRGTVQQISWRSFRKGSAIALFLQKKGEDSMVFLVARLSFTDSYNWNIPQGVNPGTYRIAAIFSDAGSTTAYSDYFTIE